MSARGSIKIGSTALSESRALDAAWRELKRRVFDGDERAREVLAYLVDDVYGSVERACSVHLAEWECQAFPERCIWKQRANSDTPTEKGD